MKEFNAKGCFYLTSELIGTDRLLWSDYIETIVRNSKKGEFHFMFNRQQITYMLDDKKSYEKAMQDMINKLKTISDIERNEHMQQFYNTRAHNAPEEFYFADWDQIRELDKNILEAGSHTKTHPNCGNLCEESEFNDEIGNSKTDIEEQVGYEVKHFNYPSGSYNSEVIKYVNKYDYRSAVTIIPGFIDEESDLFQLKRIIPDENMLLFKAFVSGSYFFIKGLYRKIYKR